MQNFKPGTDVPLTFSLLDESGTVLTPTSLRWRVLNEAETEVLAWAVVALPLTSEVSVTIPASVTALVAPALRGIRMVELEVTTATSTEVLSQPILLQNTTALEFGTNTFQTYTQALLRAEGMMSDQVAGWGSAARDVRENALAEAFSRILLLPINTRMDLETVQNMLTQDSIITTQFSMLRYLTPTQMGTLYAPLLEALRKAQIIEAAEILNGDPIKSARESGLMSMTVGESSQFFRSAKPIEMAISPKAMAPLQRWLRFGARIGRR